MRSLFMKKRLILVANFSTVINAIILCKENTVLNDTCSTVIEMKVPSTNVTSVILNLTTEATYKDTTIQFTLV